MKKVGYIMIGMLMGIVLSVTASVYGAEITNLIGMKVDGQTPVYLDGEKLDDAIIVDSKSYAPIRKIGEATGKEVSFNEGEIYLSTPEQTQAPTDPTPAPEENKSNRTVESIESQIRTIKTKILANEKSLEVSPIAAETLIELKAILAELEAEKAALQAQ